VFAGCLDVSGDGAKKLQKEGGEKLIPVQLNVVSDDDVNSALEEITEEISKRGINGIKIFSYF